MCKKNHKDLQIGIRQVGGSVWAESKLKDKKHSALGQEKTGPVGKSHFLSMSSPVNFSNFGLKN